MSARLDAYNRAVASYLGDVDHPEVHSMEPGDAVRHYDLKPSRGVNPSDYPPGTWFYYPAGREDGVCYVRRT